MSANELPDMGDFGRIVQGCECGGMDDEIGKVALVTAIEGRPHYGADCPGCRRMILSEDVAGFAYSPQWKPGDCYPRAWMRKEPPPSETVDEIEREAVPA